MKKENKQLQNFDLELVIYDELEYFYDWDHELFNYPYQLRKNVIHSFKQMIPGELDQNYNYKQVNIKFARAEVCLQENIMA